MKQIVSLYACPADGRLQSPQPSYGSPLAAYTSYVGVTGHLDDVKSGIFARRRGIDPLLVTDGLSNTIAIGERPPPGDLSIGWWYTTHPFQNLSLNDFELTTESGIDYLDSTCGGWPVDWPGKGRLSIYLFGPGSLADPCDRYHFWSLHSGGANFLFADGSARFLAYSARFQSRNLASIAAGD